MLTVVLGACQGTPPASPAESSGTSSGPGASPDSGNSPAATQSGTAKEGGNLVVAIASDITSTDPAFSGSIDTSYVETQVMQTLVRVKPGSTTFELAPYLAKSWTESDDGLSYTFELQDGVKFHDGTDFNADAVCFNYNRWINFTGTLASPDYSYYVGAIFGGYGNDANFAGCTANGSNEVVLKLKRPIASFLASQTLPNFGIASPAALKKLDADNPDPTKSPYNTGAAGAMNGTGPFMFKEWVSGDHVLLVKNPNYWDASQPVHLDSITIKPIPNTTAALNALQSGDIDLATVINPADIPVVQGDSSLTTVPRGTSCSTFYLGMNQTHPPFDNPKVRQAVALAVNKQNLVDTFYGGSDFALPANSWIPPLVPSHKDVLPAPDTSAAKQMLQDSGLSPDQLKIDLWYPSEIFRAYMPDPKGEVQAIAQDLQAAGFAVNIQTAPWRPGYVSDAYGGKYGIWFFGWPCDYPTPDNFMDTGMFYYSGGKPNVTFAYKNDALNQLMVSAESKPSLDDALGDWEKVQDMLAADMPSAPLVHAVTVAAAKTYVKDYVPSSTYVEYLNTIWLDK
jgi:peptide/nickel transport system substrate-binding protein